MIPTVCILCGTNDHAVTLYPANIRPEDMNPEVFSARRIPDGIHGETLRCERCGLVYAKELPDAAVTSRLYRDSAHTYGDMEPSIRRTYLRYARKALRTLPQKTGRRTSMDIGCGSGFMVAALADMGWDARGLEPSSDAIATAAPEIQKKISQGLASPALLPPHRFDLVTCFQTLDHVGDPLSFLKLCRATLKPGGIALFINHDIGSWTARILGERCPMIDVEHTFLYDKKTMRALFERSGFQDVRVFSVRNDYPLRYWMRLLPLPASWKTSAMRILRRFPFGDAIVPLRAGNLGLIARKPTGNDGA